MYVFGLWSPLVIAWSLFGHYYGKFTLTPMFAGHSGYFGHVGHAFTHRLYSAKLRPVTQRRPLKPRRRCRHRAFATHEKGRAP